MNIEPGTIITAVLFLLVCSIPFILLGRNGRKREKHFTNRLIAIATKNNCNISRLSAWGHAAIGMDERSQMVFFASKAADQHMEQSLSLQEIQKCRVVNTNRNSNHNNGSMDVSDKLELAFTPKDKNRPEPVFTFYDADHNGAILTGELQVAEKWCRIINEKIAAKERD